MKWNIIIRILKFYVSDENKVNNKSNKKIYIKDKKEKNLFSIIFKEKYHKDHKDHKDHKVNIIINMYN